MELEISSLVKFYTLLLLSEGPKHGYTLMKELEIKIGKRVSASQVYPFLRLLEKNKLVSVEITKGREKKVYNLTKEGNAFINKFLQRFGDLLHMAIETKLTKCAHCGCKMFECGHKERIKEKDLLFCCKHCANSFKHCK